MIKTLFIHAGSHKTGTTSIQKFLKDNVNDLEVNEGLCVPSLKGMLKLTPDLKDYGLFPNAFHELRFLNCDKAVISRENFSWVRSKPKLIKLKSVLDKYAVNTKVVFYIRRQDSLAISQKQEGTKWLDCSIAYGHEPKALPSNLSDSAENYLNYYGRISLWADIFGDENIVVRIFDKKTLENNDVVCDFCSVIGVDFKRYPLPNKINESLSRSSQLFLHQTRDVFKEGTKEKHRLVKSIRRIDKNLPNHKLLPSRKEAQIFYERFKEQNKLLNDRFSISDIPSIFHEDFSMYPISEDAEGLSQSELNSIYKLVIDDLVNEKPNVSELNDVQLSMVLKQIAISFTRKSLSEAIKLLEVASFLNPKGFYIKKKLFEYKSLLNKD